MNTDWNMRSKEHVTNQRRNVKTISERINFFIAVSSIFICLQNILKLSINFKFRANSKIITLNLRKYKETMTVISCFMSKNTFSNNIHQLQSIRLVLTE